MHNVVSFVVKYDSSVFLIVVYQIHLYVLYFVNWNMYSLFQAFQYCFCLQMFQSYQMNMALTVVFVMVSDQSKMVNHFHNEYKNLPLFISYTNMNSTNKHFSALWCPAFLWISAASQKFSRS